VGDWYYIGHYGQLGPLTREQVDELIQGGVISRDTFVWRAGMHDWLRADSVAELMSLFNAQQPLSPPPPPTTGMHGVTAPLVTPTVAADSYTPFAQGFTQHPAFHTLKSDKSRVLSGILQIVLPGVGRMYMGYPAIGVLQLVFAICTGGVGALWSIIDGIMMLTGNVKLDGYGRRLED
jgi:TM2 domain-containing membrane protein YozV